MGKTVNKAKNIVLATAVTMAPITATMTVSANGEIGLSTAYTGDEILQYAKNTYDDWSYQDADTCTGFVSHVLYEDLKVPVGMDIAGPRVFVGYGWEPYNGYLTDYNPDEMIAIANQKVQEGSAMLVYEGSTEGVYSSRIPIRNGDIVMTSRADMGAAYGHVALMEVRDNGDIGWFGAHGPIGTLAQEVSFMCFGKPGESGKYTRGTAEDAPNFYVGNHVVIYRYVDFEEPDYHSDIDGSKEITYSLAVKETAKGVNEPVEGTEYVFRNAEGEEVVKTDKQGIARKSIINRFDVNPEKYRYITNYDKLSKENKAKVDSEGVYHSYEEAQAKADEDLMEQAVKNKIDFSGYTVTRKETGNKLTLENPKAETEAVTMELVEEDARLTKQSVKIVGFAVGARCAIYDSNENLVEEFLTRDIGQGTAGYFAKNLTQNETYKVREIQEPQGYLRSQDVTFTVGAGDNTAFLQEKPIMATVKMVATGNVFDKFEDGNPVYKKEDVDKVTYTIFAKEDIKTGTKIVYTHGQEVATFTDEVHNLPVGHYYITLADTPKGYTMTGEKYDLVVENGATADPVYEINVDLQQQSVKLKLDGYSDVNHVTIYSKEDNKKLFASQVKTDGTVIATETQCLPVGKYYMTLNGKESDKVDFEISGVSSEVTSYTKNIYKGNNNGKDGSVQLTLQDSEKHEPIQEAGYILSDTENFEKTIQEGKTDSKGSLTFDKVPYGTYYIRQSEKAGDFALSEKTYRVELTKDVSDISIVATNRTAEAIIESKDLGGVLAVEGVEFRLIDENGKTIDKWQSNKMAHIITGMKEGATYRITATNEVQGYDKPADVEFTMKDGITVVMKSKKLDNLIAESAKSLLTSGQVILAWLIALPFALIGRQKYLKRKLRKLRK